MSAISAALLTYSGQLLILVAVAAFAVAAVGLSLPAARLQYWRAVVGLCVLLPFVPSLGTSAPAARVTFEIDAGSTGPAVTAAPAWWAASAVSALLPWAIAAGIAARLLWLTLGAICLRQLRRRSRPASLDSDLAGLHRTIAPEALVRTTNDLTQPVTFGWRRPIVLLPPAFEGLGSDGQRAVLCHELLHVRRRDWPGIVCEELLRAVFWFHPAMWWALEQLHLGREQVVDQLVVARTPSRRGYMDALVRFAEAPDAVRPAIAFLRRRHLATRLRQLAKEPHMTRLRLASVVAVLAVVIAGTAATVLSALPLRLEGLAAQGRTSLEVRLAESQPGAGLIEAPVQGSDKHDSRQRGHQRQLHSRGGRADCRRLWWTRAGGGTGSSAPRQVDRSGRRDAGAADRGETAVHGGGTAGQDSGRRGDGSRRPRRR